jgi:hypothetical protein
LTSSVCVQGILYFVATVLSNPQTPVSSIFHQQLAILVV